MITNVLKAVLKWNTILYRYSSKYKYVIGKIDNTVYRNVIRSDT